LLLIKENALLFLLGEIPLK